MWGSTRGMLKKSLFSPAQPWRAETRLFPGGALALRRRSTYRRTFSEVGMGEGVFPLTKIHWKSAR